MLTLAIGDLDVRLLPYRVRGKGASCLLGAIDAVTDDVVDGIGVGLDGIRD